jgi:hypothetical protein
VILMLVLPNTTQSIVMSRHQKFDENQNQVTSNCGVWTPETGILKPVNSKLWCPDTRNRKITIPCQYYPYTLLNYGVQTPEI